MLKLNIPLQSGRVWARDVAASTSSPNEVHRLQYHGSAECEKACLVPLRPPERSCCAARLHSAVRNARAHRNHWPGHAAHSVVHMAVSGPFNRTSARIGYGRRHSDFFPIPGIARTAEHFSCLVLIVRHLRHTSLLAGAAPPACLRGVEMRSPGCSRHQFRNSRLPRISCCLYAGWGFRKLLPRRGKKRILTAELLPFRKSWTADALPAVCPSRCCCLSPDHVPAFPGVYQKRRQAWRGGMGEVNHATMLHSNGPDEPACVKLAPQV